MPEHWRILIIGGLSTSLLAGCATSARIGDDVLRKSSFGRVQATPFSDMIAADECRDSLTRTLGFKHQTLSVSNGVQVTQDYRCEAETVIATVSLRNRNRHPVVCIAQTDKGEHSAYVGASGVAHFEYAYRHSASHKCFQVTESVAIGRDGPGL